MKPILPDTTKIRVADLNFFYRDRHILKDLTVSFEKNAISALIGPSGAGKSTFLITLNRLWEHLPEARMSGGVEISLDGLWRNIYDRKFPVTDLRRRVAMVFQTPNPLPMSIARNVSFPLRMAGNTDREAMRQKVEEALKMAYLWEEVKDRMNEDARKLSGGQQQRLCLARALVLQPEVLLMDEPTSSLDATATDVIEELLLKLKKDRTVLVVSHYLDQVKRVADRVITFADGVVVSS
ncbi:phosphate ABC transporter ATP-binding protein, PhoT family [Syntrophus gentianae]|uniref:Phosphate ABC transporter ATP-binding protein, PhoT family n=1 Tax=Syntrophus gentianae TaxID=43775 RepID=A0A1H7YWG6_9BACT|nr:phosphate ABC transporter ATP-binding protein [Syntrophus gentianae]SEM50285.1 phosphate ABC transporter ATP-binding protein, PhoT family [Syntrophus gentianae]